MKVYVAKKRKKIGKRSGRKKNGVTKSGRKRSGRKKIGKKIGTRNKIRETFFSFFMLLY
ncbi:MAG: hypothetical protein QW648_04250 [Nanoarchaeales archaeon]